MRLVDADGILARLTRLRDDPNNNPLAPAMAAEAMDIVMRSSTVAPTPAGHEELQRLYDYVLEQERAVPEDGLSSEAAVDILWNILGMVDDILFRAKE